MDGCLLVRKRAGSMLCFPRHICADSARAAGQILNTKKGPEIWR